MNLWNEILEEHKKGNLSNEQMRVFVDFLNKFTYEQIRGRNSISCNNVVIRIIIRTVQLKKRIPNSSGGNDFYLCERDKESFSKFLSDQANEINCVACSMAKQLTQDLKRSRIKKELIFLKIYIDEIRAPSREWIYLLAEQLDFKIVSSQTLEYGRFFVIMILL